MSDLYELHITVNIADAELADVVARDLHWKTSQIMGDPVLGNKPFHYLTTYSSDEYLAYVTLAECCNALRQAGVGIIREKIELIVYDKRY